ncbi:MAG: hypothetical protein Q9157_009122, partial [Trypethelium eluteriae]
MLAYGKRSQGKEWHETDGPGLSEVDAVSRHEINQADVTQDNKTVISAELSLHSSCAVVNEAGKKVCAGKFMERVVKNGQEQSRTVEKGWISHCRRGAKTGQADAWMSRQLVPELGMRNSRKTEPLSSRAFIDREQEIVRSH